MPVRVAYFPTNPTAVSSGEHRGIAVILIAICLILRYQSARKMDSSPTQRAWLLGLGASLYSTMVLHAMLLRQGTSHILLSSSRKIVSRNHSKAEHDCVADAC